MAKINSILIFCIALLFLFSCEEQGKKKGNDTPVTTEDALAELNNKIKKNPNDASLYLQKGELLLKNGNISESLLNLISATDLDSTDAQAWSKLADVYMIMENFFEAENSMLKAHRLDPENEDIMLKLAKHYLIFQSYEDVNSYLTRILEKNNYNAKAYYLRGVYNMELGDTIRAIQDYNKTLEIDPDSYDAHMSLALLYDLKNNPVAIDYYENAIAIRPNFLPAQYNLAYHYQEKLGRIDEALGMYDNMLQKDSTYYNALYNKGYIYLVYRQDPKTALEYFTRAAEVAYPQNPEVLYNMGYCLELMDKRKEARSIYKSIQERYPDYMLAIEGLKRVGRYDWL